MSRDLLLHIQEPLDADARRALLAHLERSLGLTAPSHVSAKPHLLFCPADADRVPPHVVLQAVRERGYHARLVDL
ncbi:MAG: hypothetical protein LJE69_09250 [Thiohalocapsa sp.]|jgi:hypothetical protein|uniref:hypothetical protein n=1 Tax=Thiohalocapsa sp. TaxID=2497641 RepID=UPI0025ECBB6B|nr:hypothetical protein [Thiohalocapsa sp.]MCG6941425.1 hypothetical protein [Thiohalocapsa sp.]